MGRVVNKIKRLMSFDAVADECIDKDKTQILHMSDTPAEIHPKLIKLVKHVKPDYLIHTGDLVDDIKMGNNEVQSDRYVTLVEKFIDSLLAENLCLFIVPGNHDCLHSLNHLAKKLRFQLISPNEPLEIVGKTFQCSHYPPYLTEQMNLANYILYGHNYQRPKYPELSDTTKNDYQGIDEDVNSEVRFPIVLNGIEALSLIQVPGDRVFQFSYPRGTDHMRKYNQSMRLL